MSLDLAIRRGSRRSGNTKYIITKIDWEERRLSSPYCGTHGSHPHRNMHPTDISLFAFSVDELQLHGLHQSANQTTSDIGTTMSKGYVRHPPHPTQPTHSLQYTCKTPTASELVRPPYPISAPVPPTASASRGSL